MNEITGTTIVVGLCVMCIIFIFSIAFIHDKERKCDDE